MMRKLVVLAAVILVALVTSFAVSSRTEPAPPAIAAEVRDEAVNLKVSFAPEQDTLTWEANPDELLVGWRIVKQVNSGAWETAAELRDPTARKYTLSLPPGPVAFHVWAVIKTNMKEVSGTTPGSSPPPVEEPPKEEPSATWRPFNDSSPYNLPVVSNPILDPNSSSMVAGITGEGGAYALMHEFGNPVVEAPPGTAGVHVRIENHWTGFYEGNVPIPSSTKASVGSDASLVVIDKSHGVAYDFWRMKWTGSEWVAGYATKFSITGTGAPPEVTVGATGSNIPLLALMIRGYEIEAGLIPHAIDIATNKSGNTYRFPATKTDGHTGYPPGLPEGTRLQLDPTVNCTANGESRGEATVCHAAETYGVYVRNTTSPQMAVGFEDVGPVTSTNPYYKAGLTSDGIKMTHIPWSRLRVLRSWNGQ